MSILTLGVPILALSLISGQLIKTPLGLGGITLLDLVVTLFSLLFILKLKVKNIPLTLSPFLVFLSIGFLELMYSPLELSPNEFINSSFYTVRLLIYAIFGIAIFHNPFKIKTKSFEIIVYSSLIIAVLGLFQVVFVPDLSFLESNRWDPHYFRNVSTFLDPNFVGSFYVMGISLLFIFKEKAKSLTFIPFFVVLFLGILTTFSRSTYLMLLISFFLISIFRKSLKTFILTGVLGLALFIGFYFYTQFVTIPRNIDRQASASYRFSTWQQGIDIFYKSPIFGVGFNAYKYAIEKYNLGDSQFLQARGATSNDSSLLFVLSTTGILGALSYLIFLGFIFKIGWKNYQKNNHWGLFCISIIPPLIFQSFFSNTLFYPAIFLCILLMISNLSE